MKLLEPLKKLPQGYYRLVIVGWVVLPLIVAGISASTVYHGSEDTFFGTLVFSVPIYYVLARVGIWIYDGFKAEKE